MEKAALLLLALAMAGFSAYQIVRKYKNIAFIMLLFWSVLAWRIVAPQPWQIVALVALLLLHLGLRFLPVWQARVDFAIGMLFLRRLSREERAQRASLSPDDRRLIEVGDWLFGKRLTEEEVNDTLESHRRLAWINEQDKASARQRSLEEALERQREEAERQSLEVTPSCTPLPIRFHTAESREFATPAGTPLVIPAGDHTGELVLHLPDCKKPEYTDTAPLEVDFTYIGTDGYRWQCIGVLNASLPLDLERLAKADPQAHICFWEVAETAFRLSFQHRCVMAGLRVSDDSRERFPLTIGGRVSIIVTHYRSWKVDLAVDEDGRRIWVRVSELYAEIWEGDPLGENAEAAEWKNLERVPAFYYSLPIEEFLPVTAPGRFAPTLDEVWEIYRDGDGCGLVFTPVAD